MTVREYINLLKQMPPDASVICDRFSDYEYARGPVLEEAIEAAGGEWLMRTHPSMTPAERANVVRYVWIG